MGWFEAGSSFGEPASFCCWLAGGSRMANGNQTASISLEQHAAHAQRLPTMAEPLVQQHRLTTDRYHAMIEAGILTENDRVELINGSIIDMSPIGPRHYHTVISLTQTFSTHVGTQALVSVQNPIHLPMHSEPEPDIVLLRPEMPKDRIARPEDILLVVEVSDSTLAFDRSVKLPLYAEAGLPEVWIVALPEDVLEVYRAPRGRRYTQAQFLSGADTVAIEALPEVEALTVGDFFID